MSTSVFSFIQAYWVLVFALSSDPVLLYLPMSKTIARKRQGSRESLDRVLGNLDEASSEPVSSAVAFRIDSNINILLPATGSSPQLRAQSNGWLDTTTGLKMYLDF
jgi:hypothetical protein